MNSDDEYDYWVSELPQTRAPQPTLQVSVIDAVEPLDDQFGLSLPKTVPDALIEVLFGQTQFTAVDSADGRIDGAEQSLVRTYAILDGAKIHALPELLESSGLEHGCLFQGEAFADLSNVAPWIVCLERGARFTQSLFTEGDAAWHLWGQDVGIYLRSEASLDSLRGHFRKFTRVQDRKGKWLYLRFYDPAYLLAYLPSLESKKLKTFMGEVSSMIAISDGTAHVLSSSSDGCT